MKTVILCYLLLASFLCFSQAKNKKVTVVTSANETIYGTVDDKEWLTNPSVIKIKRTGSAIVEEFKPPQVKSIRIENGDYYESHLIKIDITPSEFDGALFDSSQIRDVEKHVFLLVQFSNEELSLYSYRTKNQMLFYLKNGNEIPQELIYRKYSVRRDNGIFEMEAKTYTQQLSFLAENCSEIESKLTSLSYKLADIINLLKTYHKNCGKNTTTYLHTQPGKGKFSVSVLAGGSKTDLSFKSNNPDAVYVGVVTRTALKTKTTVALGLRLNYFIPRAHQKISLSFDLYYNHYTASTSEYTHNYAADHYEIKTLTISPKYLHSTFGLKYFLNRENNIRPFLLAGFSESFMISHKSEAIWDREYFGTHSVTSAYPFPGSSLKKSSFGWFLGIGFSYKKFGIDYRYHSLGSLAVFSFIASENSATTLLVSYQLTR